jgi:3-hydroxyacyl-[acyl-carrier-protein] dehydratase
MRLVEEAMAVVPGESARTRRVAHAEDWYFQGHFPDQPIVPAVILVELLAQTGGMAACSDDHPAPDGGLRLAALSGFKFPAAAGPGAVLEATARVVGRVAGLIKIEGEVTADGRRVAIGGMTLAPAPTATPQDRSTHVEGGGADSLVNRVGEAIRPARTSQRGKER